MRKVLIIGAAAFVVYSLMKYNKLNKGLSFSYNNLKLSGTFLEPVANVSLNVTNSTDYSTTFKNLFAQVFLKDGTKIGDVMDLSTHVIAPMQNNVVSIPVDLMSSGILTTIKNLIGKQDLSFAIKGTVNIDGLNVPFDYSYTA